MDVRRLAGRDGYRLRVGDWRVLYDLDERLRVIDVVDVRQRKEAYR
jgi:mRNA interferase RelE/StbE